jgi:hypothetical protein
MMADRLCGGCKHYGGLNMKANAYLDREDIPPLGGYWCWAEREYLVDTRVECAFFDPVIPLGTICTHPNMIEDNGQYNCPDCELEWEESEY